MLKLNYADFNQVDGGVLTVEQRIQSVVEWMAEGKSYAIFEDGRKCSNEQELRDILKEKGYIQ